MQKTNYNRDIVTQTMRKFAKSDRYKYTQAELNTLKKDDVITFEENDKVISK